MVRYRRNFLFLILLLLLLPARGPGDTATVYAQTATDQEVEELLAALEPAARVGQLFMVTFNGSEAPPGSAISRLVTEYQIGGVVLQAANGNIDDRESAPQEIAALANTLQEQAFFGVPQPVSDTLAVTPTPLPPPAGLPLFVAVAQAGDSFPGAQILSGLTPLPSQMAIGATWDPSYAEVTGVIAGQQLSALGINMLLGPSLDVLAEPNPYAESSVGTRTFGGSPYWVGQLGQAFTGGVHSGSTGRMAVVAGSFPGQGSSDRMVDEEIATVRKTLNDLRATDLQPFFTVTSGPEAREQVDALQTSQVRYQGLQGVAGSATAPFSFDPQAIGAVLNLPEISPWRRAGGILFSGPLGTQAIERYYAEGADPFPHRQVAKDAFLAGHDLLFLTDFAASGADEAMQIANIEDTIRWFQERYETDITFRQQVDASVRRILRLKLRLYDGNLTPENVQVPQPSLNDLVQAGNTLMFDLARQALTAIAPAASELPNQLQSPPQAGENIVIFTEQSSARQCPACESRELLGVRDLEQRLLALYGPSASNQLVPGQISSYPVEELSLYLQTAPVPQPPPTPDPQATPDVFPPAPDTPTPEPTATTSPAFFVQESLRDADWIIFAVRDVDPATSPLREFLRTQDELLRQARVVVLAFGAPYYLDTTETSKLTAYFAAYSIGAPFVDAAARALFLEAPLSGDSPVDIPGTGYALEEVTLPDPNQVIGLYIEQDEEEPAGEPGPLEVLVGQTLRLTTGVVLDYNGHPVPDGTVVSFIQQDRVQGFSDVIAQRPTQDGVATLDYLLEARTGNFRLTVRAGEADASLVIDLVIDDETVGVLAVSSPTPRPTPTPTPTGTPTPTPSVTPTPSPTLTATPALAEDDTSGLRITPLQLRRLSGLLLGVLLVGGVGSAMAQDGRLRNRRLQLQLLLIGLCSGLSLFVYLALGLPGASLLDPLGGWDAFLILGISGVVAMLVAWARS